MSSTQQMLFETYMYIGPSEQELKKISLKAGKLRVSNDKNEALFGEHCCDLIFSFEGEEDEYRTISAPSKFYCITNLLGHCREWLRGILEGEKQASLYIEVEGEYRELPLDLIFATNDCITWEMEDKIEFAEAKGYREDWQSVEAIEPSIAREYTLELMSDFGQIQIIDESFDDMEPPDWDEKALKDFACYAEGALFLRVMENDNHQVKFKICESEPVDDIEQFLHIVDAPFITKGLFEVADQPIKAAPGKYVMRWYVKQLKDANWEYQLKMWPKNTRKVSVHKRYEDEN